MKAVIQRVLSAQIEINNSIYSSIKQGLLIFLGIAIDDTKQDLDYLVKKIIQLRIFSDEQNKMNYNLNDISGEILLVSQFTLIANTKKGNRPSFIEAAPPNIAIPIYELFIAELKKNCTSTIKTGVFGADMKIQLTNDGPVTIIIDSKLK
jgi:D-tyrosyl-tRNA(Tyr) deacylase